MPTAAAARYVAVIINHLLNSTVVTVVLILSEPLSTALMSPQRLRRGLAEPKVYYLLKEVHAMSVMPGRHMDVSYYLQPRADRKNELWWGYGRRSRKPPDL